MISAKKLVAGIMFCFFKKGKVSIPINGLTSSPFINLFELKNLSIFLMGFIYCVK